MSKSSVLETILRFSAETGKSFDSTFAKMQKQFSGVSKSLETVHKVASTAAQVTGAAVTAIGGAVVTGAAVAVNQAADYQTQLQNVATLLDGTETQVAARTAKIGKDLLTVSNRTKMTTDDLTDGMYQVVSAFGDSEDAVSILTTAAKAAKAGNAVTTDSINLLSAVTKGYGDVSAEAVQKASDLSFVTVKLGQTSFPELAGSLGKVVPLASALKVSQEDLYGVFATLTGVTGSTAEVATQYKAVLSGLMTPSGNMVKALGKIGYSTADAAIEALGFQGTLNALMGTVDGDTQQMAKLFSSVEAQTAILALCGAQADVLTEKTKAMYEAAGATDAAFEKQTDTLQSTIAGIKNMGSNFMTAVGQKILPYVHTLAEKAMPLIEKGLATAENKIDVLLPKVKVGIEKLLPKVQKGSAFVKELANTALPILKSGFEKAQAVIKNFGNGFQNSMQFVKTHKDTILKIITPVATFIGVFAGGIKTFRTVSNTIKTVKGAIDGVKTAFKLLSNPVGIAIVAIAALVAAGVAIYQNWDKIKAGASALHGKLLEVWSGIKTGVGTALSSLVAAFQGQFPLLAAYLSGWWKSIQDVWENVKAIFTNMIGFIKSVFTGDWEAAWDHIVQVFGNLFGMLGNLVKAPMNGIISVINSVIEKINGLNIKIPEWVPGFGGSTLGFNLPTIPMLANGGVVTKPTLALVGEGSEDEAVLPLSKLRSMMSGNGGYSFTFAPVIHVAPGIDSREIQRIIEDERRKFERQMDRWMKEQKRRKFAES